METDKYASKLNVQLTVFVKGYSASVRTHVEMPNAPIPPYHQQITSNHRSHKSWLIYLKLFNITNTHCTMKTDNIPQNWMVQLSL